MDATFLRGLLEEEGIRAVVQGEALQETWGNLNLTSESLPSVWVDEADAGKAAPVIEEYRRRDAANAEPGDGTVAAPVAATSTWVCDHCGKRIENQFTQCWHCGHQRPTGPGGGTALA